MKGSSSNVFTRGGDSAGREMSMGGGGRFVTLYTERYVSYTDHVCITIVIRAERLS